MPRFSPARKLPSVIGLFAVATPFVALLAASFRAYKRSWPADALLDLFGVVFIAVAVSSLLVAEVMRQRKAEISGAGFFVTEWCLSRRFPFFSNVQSRYRWSDVEDIVRNGYTLIFKTQAGRKKSISLGLRGRRTLPCLLLNNGDRSALLIFKFNQNYMSPPARLQAQRAIA